MELPDLPGLTVRIGRAGVSSRVRPRIGAAASVSAMSCDSLAQPRVRILPSRDGSSPPNRGEPPETRPLDVLGGRSLDRKIKIHQDTSARIDK